MESSSSVELQSKGGVEKKKKLGEAAAAAPGLLSSSVQAAGGGAGAGDGKLDAEAEEEEFGFDANGEIASDAVVVGNMNESTTTTTKGAPHGTPPFSRRLSRKLTRPDSLDVESMRVRGMEHGGHPALSLGIILQLAYQSIGVVYGDLGTSPLYVYSSTFQGNMVTSDGLIKTPKDILGALCLIIYTLTLIPLIKYVFIVLQANDNGEGGTFALYSLICRHARIPLAHRQVPADRELSTYKLEKPTRRNARAARIKGILEKSTFLQNALIITVLCGTCLVIGDGSLTPAISVLSAMQGIEVEVPAVKPMVVVILTIVVLLIMFSLQQFGTNKVGFMFAPVVLTWFISIGLIGVYNIVSNDPSVFRALNPMYIISYFHRNKVEAWKSLGGIVLCITGTEAMFADLGHFRVSSIQIAFSGIVFPSLLSAYIGQAAYLLKHNTAEDVSYTFYKSVPKPIFWPMFAVSTGAAIIASQAMISATFSMIRNAMALGCFPRVTVRHTSKRIHGQIYIPEINWLVMCLSISIVAIFRSTTQIGNAYGIAVVGVFFISSSLLTLIMIMIWEKNIFLALSFWCIWGGVEGMYFSSVLSKVPQGGWVPLAIASFFLTVMFSWHYGNRRKSMFEVQNKLSLDWLLGLGSSLGVARVPGIGLVYTELPVGVPAIFGHFITNLPAIHSIVVFVCVRNLPVSSVPSDERILIRRVGPREFRMYRCAVRYGYTQGTGDEDEENFEDLLAHSLASFLRTEVMENTPASITSTVSTHHNNIAHHAHFEMAEGDTDATANHSMSSEQKLDGDRSPGSVLPYTKESSEVASQVDNSYSEDEVTYLYKAKHAGVVYMLGESDVHCSKKASVLKRFIVNGVYSFLRRNCRPNTLYLSIPRMRLLKVGMTYEI